MSRCRPTAQARERGVSLLELVLVVLLLAVFFGAVHETVLAGLRVSGATDRRAGLWQRFTHAFDRLSREAALASTVVTSGSAQFQFHADTDGDGATEHNITYQLSGSELQRSYGGTTVTLLRGVTSLGFTYLDAAGNATTTPADVRVVRMEATAASGEETFALANAACRRN